MKHRLPYIAIAFLFMLSFVDCAKKGSPTGGLKDSIPPQIVKSVPENYTTDFTAGEIRIYFNEYIKLKDLRKNLIISPPFKNEAIITPLNVSKTVKVQIQDTLRENTTYQINFGKSIVDNNEGNEFEHYKYVFSTGSYIDSLKLRGRVRDGLLPKLDKPTTVLLYAQNETYIDSIIYKEKPTYITNVQDSTQTFEFTNLKEGSYRLIALQEPSQDYIFTPRSDKMGYIERYVALPTDSLYEISLFKETPAYTLAKPKHETKHHIVFGYSGKPDSLAIKPLSAVPQGFEARILKDPKKDTLHYWYKPAVESDSLVFEVSNGALRDTVTAKLRKLFADSLKISIKKTGNYIPRDTLKIVANAPLGTINNENIKITERDSIPVAFSTRLDKTKNEVAVIFNRAESEKYSISVYPRALTDFFGQVNDTLRANIRTKAISDYGTLRLTLQNVRSFPITVQLTDTDNRLVVEDTLLENRQVYFDYLLPNAYNLRVIYDANANGIWDTGSFLENRQPETVVYFPEIIDVRANWDWEKTFRLK